MKAIEIFCCLAALATFTSGVEIECNYRVLSWGGNAGELYACDAIVINVEDPTTVTDISGAHMAGINNEDVNGFYIIEDRIISAIPQGIENFFENLESLLWWNGNISSIDSTVFQSFPNLKDINLSWNKLVSLDGDLFKHTRKLGGIYFDGNDLLTELTAVNFGSNHCTDAWAFTPQEIEKN